MGCMGYAHLPKLHLFSDFNALCSGRRTGEAGEAFAFENSLWGENGRAKMAGAISTSTDVLTYITNYN